LLAYYTRPEIHPVDGSCENEVRLHEDLMADPLRPVEDERLAAIADQDAADNYRIVLAYRDLLLRAGTIEGAYLRLMRQSSVSIPPIFIDQMVHLILRNLLSECADPIRLRAAEIFFREQSVTTEDGRLMLADQEIVEMHARTGQSGLGQLLSESGTPMKVVELDVLDQSNRDLYWDRSDRFDMVIDFRFEQPAPDAFARVVEGWLRHLLRIEVNVEPRPRIDDNDWRWHIGLDREATHILNSLYEGRPVPVEEMARIVGLFRMRIPDQRLVIDRVKGKPIYLGLAMDRQGRVKMKPQNLLTNLPLMATD
jgi:hypothetical protein